MEAKVNKQNQHVQQIYIDRYEKDRTRREGARNCTRCSIVINASNQSITPSGLSLLGILHQACQYLEYRIFNGMQSTHCLMIMQDINRFIYSAIQSVHISRWLTRPCLRSPPLYNRYAARFVVVPPPCRCLQQFFKFPLFVDILLMYLSLTLRSFVIASTGGKLYFGCK